MANPYSSYKPRKLAIDKSSGGSSNYLANLMARQNQSQQLQGQAEQRGGTLTKSNIDGSTYVMDEASKFTADAMNQRNLIEAQIQQIDKLESLAGKLDGGPVRGRFGQMMASMTGGSGDSTNAQLYNDLKNSSAVGFYRAATGDNRLSDADAKARALPLIWDMSQSNDLKTPKFSYLRNLALERYVSLGGEASKYARTNPIPGAPGYQQPQQPQQSQNDNDPLGLFQ